MSTRHEVPLPLVGLSGFDVSLSEEEQGVQEMIHRFARDVMRPLARELDRLPAEEAYQPGSPFWAFHGEMLKLGLGPEAMTDLTAAQRASLEGIVIEELAWGDAGLTVSAGVGGLPLEMARASGQQELIELCEGKLGCWCATQPDRGSDGLILYSEERYPGSKGNKGNLQATFKADEIIINGQTSAWVSNGPVAQVGLLDIVADYGDGFYDEHGNTYGCNIIVPLDLPGISRGKPLEKLGKRPLPQGEIYFDNVKVPRRFAIATRDDYELKHAHAWAQAGTAMSHIASGLARAAFELALAYVHERKQGGALLASHQLTQHRLGGLGMKVEAIRAMARHVAHYTKCSPRPHPYFTASGKAFCCSELMNVVNESLQLFGGNGLTREYPIEKLLRDARAMQIEDGENNILQMHYGHLLSLLHQQEGWGRA
ncbi:MULTISPECIES: acyl-CoA dehydrogenase family protein [Pseudomonas aeruginosa group]|uniref:Acyl-CoA/acyl-ACP dehydrogenase n=1 Tax=Pseudomonas nitroreducens TaxID=46680 RepID=A0A6G6IS79_PSENT|nr:MULTISPECIES: acyl-CoA dehydrogenase family protein [Pseudomonas aeruginosa group]KYO75105.1 Acyl-CoA dehydrogenase [Pseudomonas aeruginosa]QIE85995.1 acyl-CoA/acyl-ACP dehydrogenase [Pseudomonas nitroreducens]HCE6396354.1 acyl-CoA/acyl-ACP dehydrogenase [Pseudomonas aeruginosa]